MVEKTVLVEGVEVDYRLVLVKGKHPAGSDESIQAFDSQPQIFPVEVSVQYVLELRAVVADQGFLSRNLVPRIRKFLASTFSQDLLQNFFLLYHKLRASLIKITQQLFQPIVEMFLAFHFRVIVQHALFPKALS